MYLGFLKKGLCRKLKLSELKRLSNFLESLKNLKPYRNKNTNKEKTLKKIKIRGNYFRAIKSYVKKMLVPFVIIIIFVL